MESFLSGEQIINDEGQPAFDFSICVPTYNRAHLLPCLFANLGEQVGPSFELIIVNDGSVDNTAEVIAESVECLPFPTVVLHRPNRGKGAALNDALDITRGRFFFIMDDDDLIVKGALADILETWESIPEEDRPGFCGVCGLCCDEAGRLVGQSFPAGVVDDDFMSMRIVRGVRGDKREVVLRSAIGEYRLPIYEGERRTPANILWFHLAERFKMRFVDRPWLIKEYRPDGMSANGLAQKVRSPRSMSNYYRRALEGFPTLPVGIRFRFTVNYLRFAAHAGEPLTTSLAAIPNPVVGLLSVPVARLIAFGDRRRLARGR